MSLSTKPYKGARDFYPKDKRLQDYIFGKMRSVVLKFGYEEYDASIIEPLELFKSKTSDEIISEQTYQFTDRGGRAVVLRPEMTPTVSRMVAGKVQELPQPIRWFSIPNVWRYERPQHGRLREHWQLNVDIFGVAGIAADHEIILIASKIMQALGADDSMFKIKLNSRQLLRNILQHNFGSDDKQITELFRLIDKFHKIDKLEFSKDLSEIFSEAQAGSDAINKLLGYLNSPNLESISQEFDSAVEISNLKSLIALLQDSGVANAEFDPTTLRGFDYYTDIVFEVYDTNPENSRSLFGGGRYDGLMSLFGVDPLPTVGFGVGDVGLANFLKTHQLLPNLLTPVELMIIIIGDEYSRVNKIAAELREYGLNVAVDSTGRKIDKQLKAAAKQQIKFALVVGDKELSSQKYNLKNLATGQESTLDIAGLVSQVKNQQPAS